MMNPYKEAQGVPGDVLVFAERETEREGAEGWREREREGEVTQRTKRPRCCNHRFMDIYSTSLVSKKKLSNLSSENAKRL